jgi:hypothetical protein
VGTDEPLQLCPRRTRPIVHENGGCQFESRHAVERCARIGKERGGCQAATREAGGLVLRIKLLPHILGTLPLWGRRMG